MGKRDLVIIGGGAGGLVVASVASQLGLKVTLIEKQEKLGGDCLHTGCVPSKTLIQVAKVASLMRRAGEFGLEPVTPRVDLGKVSFMDSSGVGELVSCFTTVANRGGSMKLLNLTKKVHDLLQVTQLVTVFEVYRDEVEALSSYD